MASHHLSKAELIEKAIDLGIMVDETMTRAQLQSAIDEIESERERGATEEPPLEEVSAAGPEEEFDMELEEQPHVAAAAATAIETPVAKKSRDLSGNYRTQTNVQITVGGESKIIPPRTKIALSHSDAEVLLKSGAVKLLK
jgi:hypothetical protein